MIRTHDNRYCAYSHKCTYTLTCYVHTNTHTKSCIVYDIEHCGNPTHKPYTGRVFAANTHLHFMSVEEEDPCVELGYRM